MKESNQTFIKWIRWLLILGAAAIAYFGFGFAPEPFASLFLYYNLALLALVALHFARREVTRPTKFFWE